jgi:Probable molybdopterin binding domain
MRLSRLLFLVIGGKILSGRTKGQNIGYIAEYLTAFGIDLKEVRVVGDEERAIVDTLNALRDRRRDRASVRGTAPTRMWCCALVTHRNSRLPNARSRTCWSEHGEHNQIMSEPRPLTAKTGVRVPRERQ